MSFLLFFVHRGSSFWKQGIAFEGETNFVKITSPILAAGD
jgi:hypothetical protein